MNSASPRREGNAMVTMLYMALELSNKTWKMVFGDGARRRRQARKRSRTAYNGPMRNGSRKPIS